MNPKTNPISPKVVVVGIVGLVLSALASNVTALSPHAFDFLGSWGLFWFGVVVTLISTAAAWWKTDPLRVLPEDQTASETPETNAVVVNAPVTAAPDDVVKNLVSKSSVAQGAPVEGTPAVAAPAQVAPAEPAPATPASPFAAPTA